METRHFLWFYLCVVVIVSAEKACVDKNTACSDWKYGGYCKMKQYKAYMTKYCPKSCGICGPCEDDRTACPAWQKRGLCVNESYVTFMSQYCRMSCGICKVTCGKPEIQQSRVISGTDAKKGAWPWQVLMIFNGKPICGGSLISPYWVVTAAHCVSGIESNTSSFIMRVGEHNMSTTADGKHTDIEVQKIITHANYSRDTLDNDIALIKLASPAIFNKFVKTVCLPKQGQHVAAGTACYITGWGRIYHMGPMHPLLQQGKMKVRSKDECSKRNRNRQITENMICGGKDGFDFLGGCHGDSGGPFVCKTGPQDSWVLHGVVSWGDGRCNAMNRYTVFARVASLRSWIDEQVKIN